jgi:hypothetical protein
MKALVNGVGIDGEAHPVTSHPVEILDAMMKARLVSRIARPRIGFVHHSNESNLGTSCHTSSCVTSSGSRSGLAVQQDRRVMRTSSSKS